MAARKPEADAEMVVVDLTEAEPVIEKAEPEDAPEDATRELHDEFAAEFPWTASCLYAVQGTYAQAEATSVLTALRDARKAQAF
jgi:hypothetical protein